MAQEPGAGGDPTAAAPGRVEVGFGVLGDVRAVVDGQDVPELGGPQPRLVLAVLVAAGGRVVAAQALVDALWDDEPPASASGTLQSYVSRLRRALGPAAAVLQRRGAGYRLAVPEDAFDWRRFEVLAEQGRAALQAGDDERARSALVAADALWRGPALAGLRDRRFAAGLVTRLEERRESARGDRLEAELRLGRHAAVLGELPEAVRARPMDEARWARLALARYRSGQQAEALRALADARRRLVDELGVEPGQALRALELQVLRQDPALERRTPAPVTGPAPAPSRSVTPTAGAGLVGRRSELAVLLSVLEESRSTARFGVVEGEPGIGKTRLLEEVAAVARDRGALVLWGRTHESGAAPAFWPWLPVLRALRDSAPDQAEPGLVALLDASGREVAGSGAHTAMESVAAALRRASATRQVVVLLDDLQWADATSLQLIGCLAAHLVDEPVLLLATVREVDRGRRDELVGVLAAVARRRGSRRLRLAGLDVADTAALVRQTTAGEVPEGEVLAIHERAGGNPFFTAQLAELLQDSAGATGRPVPAGVMDVVRQRLAGLPPDTTALLQLCAVMGREVDLALLPLATGRPVVACLADLEPAVDQRMLTDVPDRAGALHFSHALVREVLVEDLSSVRRLRLHLSVADALEARGHGDDDAELLAEHLWAAGPLVGSDRVAAALETAAEVAVRRFALPSAVHLLDRAAELRRSAGSSDAHGEAELHAVVRLTSVRRAMQGFGGVADLLERGEALARRLGREDLERELLWARWAMYDTACDTEHADPIAERFRALAEGSTDPALRRFGLQVWGITLWHRGELLASRDAFDRGHEAGAAMDAGRPAGERAGTLLSFEHERLLLDRAFRLHVHDLLEDLPSARRELDEMAVGLDPFGRAMVATFACAGACAADDAARVVQHALPVVAADRDLTLSFWGSQARLYLGWARMRQGELEEGLRLWEAGAKGYTGAGLHTGMALFLASASLCLLDAGRTDDAADLAAQARGELEVFGEVWPQPVVLLAEAELARATGRDGTALLDRASATARAMGAVGMVRRVARAQAAR